MQNALAVYTAKRSFNGARFTQVAADVGIDLRFMAMGGYIPSNPEAIQKKALTIVNGGALLMVGALEEDHDLLAEFDELIQKGDREPIAQLLKAGKLPWCELYTGRFNYEKVIKEKPRDKPSIDGSVPKDQLSALRAAKTRYIIYNQSRRKNCGSLMTSVAGCLAEATEGIVADYQRPSR